MIDEHSGGSTSEPTVAAPAGVDGLAPTRLLPKDAPTSSQRRGYLLSELDDDAIIAALKEINALADHYSQHTSSAIRQLSLGGLAVIWLFKVQAGAAAALPRDMYKPALFLVAALALDFIYWAFGALVWKIGRRYLMGDPAPTHIAWILRTCLSTEMVGTIPSKRLRPLTYLLAASVISLLAAYGLLLAAIASRVWFR